MSKVKEMESYESFGMFLDRTHDVVERANSVEPDIIEIRKRLEKYEHGAGGFLRRVFDKSDYVFLQSCLRARERIQDEVMKSLYV